MIQRVDIRYFRCVRDVSLRLGPLTVLVGPNGSGKTALLDAMLGHGMTPTDRWRRTKKAVEIDFSYEDGRLAQSRENGGKPHEAQQLRLVPDHLRRTQSATRQSRLDPDGSNVANVLFSLGREGGRRYAEEFCRLVPVYADVDVEPVRNGQMQLRFEDRWQRGLWYEPRQVSDGTMLIAGFLAAARQLERPDLLLVEDPEHGLHPWLIGQVVQMLRSLASSREAPVQVVMATHSAELLDHLRPDEVRFVDRNSGDGATTVTEAPTGDGAWQEAFQAYRERLSEMWLSGVFGGVPSL